MKYEIVKLEEKKVVGLLAPTSNFDPNMGNIIGGLWRDFYEKGIYARIKNKSNQKALGMYLDYKSDEKGQYNAMVGCEAEKAEDIPLETTIKTVPAGKYAKFIVKGHMQQAVASFWQQLWQMDLERTYLCDFEEYQDGNMEDAVIHIYIGIK